MQSRTSWSGILLQMLYSQASEASYPKTLSVALAYDPEGGGGGGGNGRKPPTPANSQHLGPRSTCTKRVYVVSNQIKYRERERERKKFVNAEMLS